MDTLKLAKRLEGLQTVSSICKTAGVGRRTAINYISQLRKKGLVKTLYGAGKKRMYSIKTAAETESGQDFYEMLNKYSRVKIAAPYRYKVHDKKLTVEETIIRAVESGSFRIILAALGLFAHVKNWQLLYQFANKNKIGRKIGALYDAARSIIKIRKMDERTRIALAKSVVKNRYIVDKIKSRDLKDIEKRWRIYLPFNRSDLEAYKE